MFSEPSVMCVHVLPYLLRMAEKYSESSSLGDRLSMWAEENVAQVLNNLRVCKELLPGKGNSYIKKTRGQNKTLNKDSQNRVSTLKLIN